MNTFDRVIKTVLNIAETSSNLYANIIIGNTPPTNGIAMFVSSSGTELTDFEKGMIVSFNIMCNSKHVSQEQAYNALYQIHKNLTKLKVYPNENDFQITNISTVSYPSLLIREENGQYVFGSTMNVEFYWR